MTGLQVWRTLHSRTKISSQLPVLSSRTDSCFVLPSGRRGEKRTHSPQGQVLYTRRRFGGRQPLCGIGVTSLIERTSIPAAASARMADSRPEPGPATRTSTERRPWSRAMLAAVEAACCAAHGVPLREPRKPSEPELFQLMVLPCWSAIVTIVLFNVA